MILVTKVLFFLLGCFFLKNSITKFKKKYLFFEAINDYKIIKYEYLVIILVPLLITIELFVSLNFIAGFSLSYIVLLAALLQLFYIFLNIKSLNKIFSNNCGCFSLQIPRKVTAKNVLNNIIILFIIILLYGLKIRYH
ncbi:hypothetical protein PQ460_20350 [Paenibacillus sp. KACC 21273]|uniref:MauE/DoxX family redox-associated membrane protein n=1 Tax=Paenibacillus sp. KACC 21273 TaxID=3025665 RepID=UPI0023661B36|nr:MauE/DoxX family redox-associated membrane protein [Paenibacillus sp. KACC 21273]WDF50309.1 hypothetical protein PQ460_20350 [Paenibacillus sp. KACC 21273]